MWWRGNRPVVGQTGSWSYSFLYQNGIIWYYFKIGTRPIQRSTNTTPTIPYANAGKLNWHNWIEMLSQVKCLLISRSGRVLSGWVRQNLPVLLAYAGDSSPWAGADTYLSSHISHLNILMLLLQVSTISLYFRHGGGGGGGNPIKRVWAEHWSDW